MPSILLTAASGSPFPLVSGNYWSGLFPRPVGGVQLRLDRTASGNAYVGFSGGMTVSSGGFFLSGTLGVLDGTPLYPGDALFVPKLAAGVSGQLGIYATCDPACSGQARLWFETF